MSDRELKVEAMNLHLRFACTAQGECDREFFCINPNLLSPWGFPGSEAVCPHLVAWDGLAKSMRAAGIPLGKQKEGSDDPT